MKQQVFEIKCKRLIGWGGSVADRVEKAARDLSELAIERCHAACIRKYGATYEHKVKFICGSNWRALIDKDTGEDVIRFGAMASNNLLDIRKTQNAVVTMHYTTWDGKK